MILLCPRLVNVDDCCTNHLSLYFFRLDDCDEDYDTSAQTDCFMPAFAENFDEKRPVVGAVCSTGSEGDSLSAAMETTGQTDNIEFEGHEHIVQLLEKGGAGAKLPAVFETDDTDDKIVSISGVVNSGRCATELAVLGKGQKRNLSCMTKVLSTIFVARTVSGFLLC